jgi:hypothetical protein
MAEKNELETVPALIIPLSKPIQAHGEEITELRLRAPTANDVIQIGNPIALDISTDPPRATPDDRKMAQMIARLADVPPSSIGQMDPNDFTGAIIRTLPFFVPRL